MPELPEVETVRRGLEPAMKGRRITKVALHRAGLRTPFASDLASKIEGRKVLRLTRRAKYLLLYLDSRDILVLHLGMSGRLSILESAPDYAAHKHDHIVLNLDNAQGVAFNDPRRFGMAFIVHEDNLETHPSFRAIGPEPLGNAFSGARLLASLKNKTIAVKTALMDQKVVAGIGNIYACEALYEACIAPERKSDRIGAKDADALVDALRKVLERAVKAGGSSLRDHRQADGTMGYFQHEFAVYGRTGKPCPRRRADDKKKHQVQKIIQGGRSTFYCPDCQKA